MSWLRFFRRKRKDAELLDEFDTYLAEEIAENRARGMSEDEARRQAKVKLGNMTTVRENLWEQNTLSMENLWREIKYAARTLKRSPGFSLIAIAVMALCLGAATSLFTIVRSVLLRPLPFRDPDKLVMVYEHFRRGTIKLGFDYNVVSPADYYDWRAQTHGFEDMAAWRWHGFNLTGERGELPEAVTAAAGTWNLFPLLGVQPAYGRTFLESEDHLDSNVVMLTWSIFERRFAGDASIVGRQIHLDSTPYTVVGVLPKGFAYPDASVQVWVPYRSSGPAEWVHHHDWHQSHVIARLRPGVSLADAIAQVGAVQYRLHMQYLNAPVAEDVVPRSMTDDLAQDVKKPLLLLMGAVGCMLLIGCLNVANLLVARSAARQKEVAIRNALGAQRFTLIREQITESLLICFAGGLVGMLMSVAATKWLAHAWKDLPTAGSIRMDGTVFAFACALVALTALLAGLLPAISSTGKAVFATLQASTRGASANLSRTALRKTLLTIEIAVTVVLLVAAGLLVKSFVRLRTADVGCATQNVLTLSYSLPAQKYDTPEKVNAFNESLLERLRAMPGVRAAGLGMVLPGAGWQDDDIFTIPEHPPVKPGAELPDALYREADPGYFSALQIPLVQGRFFTGDDRLDRGDKIIIDQQLARQYFPGENPLGKHLHVPAHQSKIANYEIVGVVGDTLYQVGKPPKATMYFPVLAGKSDGGYALAVRTAADPLAMSIPAQRQIAAIDPELPVSDVMTMEQVIGNSLNSASFSATLVLAFAVLSLALASVGLYGVLSYLMTQRRTEIGIRMAMGAQRGQVLKMMLADGLRPALVGLAFGLVASAAAVRLIQSQLYQSMLYQTQALDPVTYGSVTATLLLVAVLACLVPAWRASRLDPTQALRTE
jgi:putative ABC transport system permease protein